MKMRRSLLGIVLLVVAAGLLMMLAQFRENRPRYETVPVHIDEVTVDASGASRGAIEVHVDGVVGDSCNELQSEEQSREGSLLRITIQAKRQLDVPCMQYAQLYQKTFLFEGDFPPGDYTVEVNGEPHRFEVKGT